MSGIAGIFDTDGRPANESALRRMLNAIAHRGPDGQSVWRNANVALGHSLLRTLPEEERETLPLAEGDFAITADARLDNRDDLIAALDLSDRSLSDAALILAAYRKWSEDCTEHFLGDFAFAIWDGRRRHLFCARDHFGVKPFFYTATPAGFSFASEMKGLFGLPDVAARVDEERIADYLVGLISDSERTLYQDIHRLPPRHSLTVTPTGNRLREYWRPDISAARSGDVAEEFRELFTTAVRCRLRAAPPAGAMLSGGLDSSSIACVGARIGKTEHRRPLPTLSLAFNQTPAWNEQRFIDAVLAQGGFEPSFEDADDCAPFADFESILSEQEGPFHAPGLAFGHRLYRAASARGIRVLLDGHGGDEVVSHGIGRLEELATSGRWLSLWQEARGVARIHGDPVWPIYSSYLNRHSGRVGRLWRRVSGSGHRNRRSTSDRPAWARFVDPEFAARSNLAERYSEQRRADIASAKDARAGHASSLLYARVPQSFEVLDRAAAAHGIEPRYPFWDKRLVEFCLSLPAEEKLKDGWSRHVLRRAMKGILPPVIQWRPGKLDFGPHIIRGMLRHHRALLDCVLDDKAGALCVYVDLPALRAAYQRVSDKAEAADGRDVKAVWRAVTLATWLNRRNPESKSTAVAA